MKTAKYVGAVSAPTLILHGTDDEIIPTSQGRAVFDACGAINKECIIIPNGTHRLFKYDSIKMILDWLSQTLSQKQ
jgi:dipeptidyl aminopeptidase/acylaminoacyl peptidase